MHPWIEHASMDSLDTYTIVGGGGGGLPTIPHPLNTSSHNTAARRPPHPSYTQQHPTTHNNTQQHTTTALGYIKLPMYQLFLWRLYLMVLRGAHHYEGHWKGWALKIETFLGPEMARAKRVPSGPKKVEITYRAIKTTGTLIVNTISGSLKVCCCNIPSIYPSWPTCLLKRSYLDLFLTNLVFFFDNISGPLKVCCHKIQSVYPHELSANWSAAI